MPGLSDEARSSFAHHGAEHVAGILDRLRLGHLLRIFPPRWVWSAYVFINGFITIALLSLLAVITGTPFVFPSLGPTAYLFFFSPLAPSARPRHAILGHGIGLLCGYGAFVLVGTVASPQGLKDGISWPTVAAAALSLSVTGAVMVLLRVSHPPAGATTLIVSLGLLSRPEHLVIVEVAVVVLTAQAFVINRLAGLPYPFWETVT